MSHFNVIDAKNPVSLMLPERITLHIFDDINDTSCEDYLNHTYAAAQITSPGLVTARLVTRVMWDFVGPVIFGIGILGNLLILLVMSRYVISYELLVFNNWSNVVFWSSKLLCVTFSNLLYLLLLFLSCMNRSLCIYSWNEICLVRQFNISTRFEASKIILIIITLI